VSRTQANPAGPSWNGSLDAATLRPRYLDGTLTPGEVVDTVLARIRARGDDHVWISRVEDDQLRARACALADGALGPPEQLPLYGLPFAIKDNIDLAGLATTCACPEAAWYPERSATVVERLLAAGALPVGKTNLDQFATGLVGVRSPYGAPGSAFDAADISGGSSAGSAVAVAADLVSFSLGTDTAGSGRVPAGCNNIVGLKPTPGAVPTTGVFPAVRSLDCVSVFALTVADALAVLRVVEGPDDQDPYARRSRLVLPPAGSTPTAPPRFRFGIPSPLEFFEDEGVAAVFADTVRRIKALGGQPVAVDFAPLAEVAALLYDGPWVAERTAALDGVLARFPAAVHPVVRSIVEGGRRFSAVDAHRARYRLAELRARTSPLWDELDVLLVPTTGTTYTIAEVEADPVSLNSTLGHYTNFVNLLGLAALAVPAGFTPRGRPAGVTLIGAAGHDVLLAAIGAAIHAAADVPLGATGRPLPTSGAAAWTPPDPEEVTEVAVVGAHLRGQPLNHQLTELDARFLGTTTTAPAYRLFELPGGDKPGLLRDEIGGDRIEVEVWALPTPALGRLVSQVVRPLAFGRVELADGRWVVGYLAEPYGLTTAIDITAHGGWRNRLSGRGR